MNLIAIVVSVAALLGGWAFQYLNDRNNRKEEAQLARVNAQLRLLYGPLLALSRANKAVWDKFRVECWPSHGSLSFFDKGTTEEDAERWRIWTTAVFHPRNEKMEQVILENKDLMEGDEDLEAKLDVFMAHVASYRATIERWNRGDFSVNTALINYPLGLTKAVQQHYVTLRDEQSRLLGLCAPRRRWRQQKSSSIHPLQRKVSIES